MSPSPAAHAFHGDQKTGNFDELGDQQTGQRIELSKPLTPSAGDWDAKIRQASAAASSTREEQVTAPVSTPHWVKRLYAFVRAGRVEDSSDWVVSNIEDFIAAHDFAACDLALAAADVQRLNIVSMLALLASTLRIREATPARATFAERVREKLEQDVPERAERLLRGL